MRIRSSPSSNEGDAFSGGLVLNSESVPGLNLLPCGLAPWLNALIEKGEVLPGKVPEHKARFDGAMKVGNIEGEIAQGLEFLQFVLDLADHPLG